MVEKGELLLGDRSMSPPWEHKPESQIHVSEWMELETKPAHWGVREQNLASDQILPTGQGEIREETKSICWATKLLPRIAEENLIYQEHRDSIGR